MLCLILQSCSPLVDQAVTSSPNPSLGEQKLKVTSDSNTNCDYDLQQLVWSGFTAPHCADLRNTGTTWAQEGFNTRSLSSVTCRPCPGFRRACLYTIMSWVLGYIFNWLSSPQALKLEAEGSRKCGTGTISSGNILCWHAAIWDTPGKAQVIETFDP